MNHQPSLTQMGFVKPCKKNVDLSNKIYEFLVTVVTDGVTDIPIDKMLTKIVCDSDVLF